MALHPNPLIITPSDIGVIFRSVRFKVSQIIWSNIEADIAVGDRVRLETNAGDLIYQSRINALPGDNTGQLTMPESGVYVPPFICTSIHVAECDSGQLTIFHAGATILEE